VERFNKTGKRGAIINTTRYATIRPNINPTLSLYAATVVFNYTYDVGIF
jgi:hypothetical protein